MQYENLIDILQTFNLPKAATTDAEKIISETIGYAKKRNPSAAVLVCSRTLAETMSRHTLARGDAYFSISEANQLLEAIVKHHFASLYTAPTQALEEATTEDCINTLLRLETNASQHMQDTDALGLKIFPAQELCLFFHADDDERKVADCQRRWIQGGGSLYDGKMIALKMDPIWTEMSIFQLPYPPFDFQCCFGTLGVSRKDCIRLGLIKEQKHLTFKRKRPTIKLSFKIK